MSVTHKAIAPAEAAVAGEAGSAEWNARHKNPAHLLLSISEMNSAGGIFVPVSPLTYNDPGWLEQTEFGDGRYRTKVMMNHLYAVQVVVNVKQGVSQGRLYLRARYWNGSAFVDEAVNGVDAPAVWLGGSIAGTYLTHSSFHTVSAGLKAAVEGAGPGPDYQPVLRLHLSDGDPALATPEIVGLGSIFVYGY